MKRLHVYLPVKLITQLKKKARAEGIGVSELLRRIVTAHFE